MKHKSEQNKKTKPVQNAMQIALEKAQKKHKVNAPKNSNEQTRAQKKNAKSANEQTNNRANNVSNKAAVNNTPTPQTTHNSTSAMKRATKSCEKPPANLSTKTHKKKHTKKRHSAPKSSRHNPQKWDVKVIPEAIRAELLLAMGVDRFALQRDMARFFAAADKHNNEWDAAPDFLKLKSRLGASIARATARKNQPFVLNFDEELPIVQKRAQIKNAIAEHQVTIIAGETGSGKTTQIPKMCLELGRGVTGFIGHTQPRRLAALSIAQRISEELEQPLGTTVGYKMRFNDNVGENTRIKVMTDGILLAEMAQDKYLNHYDTLIIDEAHERSLNIDFILGWLKGVLVKRPDLKVIITSATLDQQKFVDYFSRPQQKACLIEVSGRGFPVTVHYRDLSEYGVAKQCEVPAEASRKSASTQNDQCRLEYKISPKQGIAWCLEEIGEKEQRQKQVAGDVLVFLATERDIRETQKFLEKQALNNENRQMTVEILPLYARLGVKSQQRIFNPSKNAQLSQHRRIILATNVAETSLTVPNIRYVIDVGLARMSRYSYKSKLQRLPIEKISQASANQRKGRCGRVMAGDCYRLYSEEDFNEREAFTAPEIHRTNLASVILKMAYLRLGTIERFPFIDTPEDSFIRDGYQLLVELQAMNVAHKITPLGKKMARYPIEPRYARILLEAEKRHCLDAMQIIIAGLSIQDPRERPPDKQQQATQQQAIFNDSRSDFISLYKLWHVFEQQRHVLSQNKLRAWCKAHFLSYARMREWREVYQQLSRLNSGKKMPVTHSDKHQGARKGKKLTKPPIKNPTVVQAGDFVLSDGIVDTLHQCLLSGLLTQVYCKQDSSQQRSHRDAKSLNSDSRKKSIKGEMFGVRNRRMFLWPGSVLFKNAPQWGVSANVLETHKVYALSNAPIKPEWLAHHAQHLLKYSHHNPFWDNQRGEVQVYEQAHLFGLLVYTGKIRALAQLEGKQAEARRVFIASALAVQQDSSAVVHAVVNDVANRAGLRSAPLSSSDYPFLSHNAEVVGELIETEAKLRRQGEILAEGAVTDFYHRVLPEKVYSTKTLQQWLDADAEHETRLLLDKAQYLTKAGILPDEAKFPVEYSVRGSGLVLSLSYHFDPLAEDDGVSLYIPVVALNQINAQQLDWLVPGFIEEKITAILKSLPKRYRRLFVPAKSYAQAVIESLVYGEGDLLTMIARQLTRMSGKEIPLEAFDMESLAPHLLMNLCVIDDEQTVIAESRSLDELKQRFHGTASAYIKQKQGETESPHKQNHTHQMVTHKQSANSREHSSNHENTSLIGQRSTYWSFGDLPRSMTQQHGDIHVTSYVALTDSGSAVEVELFDDPLAADWQMRLGLRRLFYLTQKKNIKGLSRQLPQFNALVLLYRHWGDEKSLYQHLALLACELCFLPKEGAFYSKSEFEMALNNRNNLFPILEKLASALFLSLQTEKKIRQSISHYPAVLEHTANDIALQCEDLFADDFLGNINPHQLLHYPRYTQAIAFRWERLHGKLNRDLQLAEEMEAIYQVIVDYRQENRVNVPLLRMPIFWLLQEYRVKAFAQHLKTSVNISPQKIHKALAELC